MFNIYFAGGPVQSFTNLKMTKGSGGRGGGVKLKQIISYQSRRRGEFHSSNKSQGVLKMMRMRRSRKGMGGGERERWWGGWGGGYASNPFCACCPSSPLCR